MRIYKVIDINIEKERERVKKVKYEPDERKYLLRIVDLFEQGKFKEAFIFAMSQEAYMGFIGLEIWDVLWDFGRMQSTYKVHNG